MIAPTRVALVDDDASIRRGVARMLELSGLRVTTFDSAEALLADGPSSAFDCLVLDVHLPGLSGPECYGSLRARGQVPPAVFITAHDEIETQEMLQRAGAASCLRKPFRGQQLLDAIRHAVDGTAPGHARLG
jgi:FixJ family two-component response regulator